MDKQCSYSSRTMKKIGKDKDMHDNYIVSYNVKIKEKNNTEKKKKIYIFLMS